MVQNYVQVEYCIYQVANYDNPKIVAFVQSLPTKKEAEDWIATEAPKNFWYKIEELYRTA